MYEFLDEVEQFTPNEKETMELQQLAEIAAHIGSYEWKYDKGDFVDGKLHDGPVAQELLEVPGLAAAVRKNSEGILEIDTKYISLATLGYVAALTRLLIKVAGGK